MIFSIFISICSAEVRAEESTEDVVALKELAGKSSDFPEDITDIFLRDFNNGIRRGALDSLNSHNIPVPASGIKVTTKIVDFYHNKILETHIEADGIFFLYKFLGKSGGNLFSVSCVSRTAKPFEVSVPACQQQVQLAFGN
ncbi:hypothetical protein H7F51_10885 [Novosphingobium flavum]|uniref:Uncharacterized protein n=1 Tax=Novosphingobium flavum TaxID=1778672 RepID=A0A7X1FT72_9SPHN|nr:hypothetical protein [Novosphingobium flavum]MBC2666032.1 hypothetical protein [Novosphingobium flavum]